MAETNGSGMNSRLDRLEAMAELIIKDHEEFRQEHKLLLRAQVVMQGQMDEFRTGLQKLANAQTELANAQTKLASAQAATEEKLHVLISTIDGWIRRQDDRGRL